MSKRGAQAVAKAQRLVSEQMAEKNSGLLPGHVKLSRAAGGLTSVPEWYELASQQPPLTEAVLLSAQVGQVFAIEDRNSMQMPWRHIYIVCEGKHYALFSLTGVVIDESDENDQIVDGRQPVAKLAEQFSVDGFWYRPPHLVRPSPEQRRDQRLQARASPSHDGRDLDDALHHAAGGMGTHEAEPPQTNQVQFCAPL